MPNRYARKTLQTFSVIGLLSLGTLAGCKKSGDLSLLTPPQDTTIGPGTYRYNGVLQSYARYPSITSGGIVVKEDSSFSNTFATLVLGTDSTTVTVDSMTHKVYAFQGTKPGVYTIDPCCRPSKIVTISNRFDSLEVRYEVTDPLGGPYYFRQRFVGAR